MRLALLFVLAALSASAQTNSIAPTNNLAVLPLSANNASIGGIQRTVRQFTTKLPNATQWQFEQNAATK